MKVAGGNLAEFSKRAKESQQSATTLDGVMNQLNMTSIAAGAGILTLYKSFTSLVSAVKGFSQQALQSYSNFEQIESGLQGVLKDVKKGTDMFEDLRKFSFDTTFGVDTLANAAQQLIGVGESASTLKTTLLQLGNVASGDTNKFNELVSIFAKIQNTGKAGSMQLQQLALRGVPIYQYLKQIGVQGTATGEDIRKAFAKMNEEGEVFYNTMDRINNTIQGKEGFISDTWREFLTSFSEASGLADMYKAALDTVYKALQGIVDWLQKINENPVTQALFRGAIVGILSSIAVFIGGGLLIAMKKVTAELAKQATFKAIIAGLSGNFLALGAAAVAAGAAIGGAVAIVSGLSNAESEADKMKHKLDELADSANAYETALKHAGEEANGLNAQFKVESGNGSFADQVVYYQNLIKRAESAQKARYGVSTALIDDYKQKLAEAEANLRAFTDAINEANRIKQENSEIQEKVNKQHEEFSKMLDDVNGKYSKTDEGKLTDIEQSVLELEKYRQMRDAVYNESDGIGVQLNLPQQKDLQDKINRLISDAEKNIHQLKVKIAVDNQSDWQKELQKLFGFSDEEVYQGATKGDNSKGISNEKKAFSFYENKHDAQQQKLQTFRAAGLITTDNLTVANEYLDTVNKIISAFEKTEDKNIDNDTIKMLQELQANAIADVFNAQIEAYDKELENFNKSAEDIRREKQRKILKDQGFNEEQTNKLMAKQDEIESVKKTKEAMDNLRDSFLAGAGELGNLIKAIQEYTSDDTEDTESVKQSILATIVSLVFKIVEVAGSKLEGEKKEMFDAISPANVLGDVFGRLTVVTEMLGEVVKPVLSIFQSIGEILNDLLMPLKPLFQIANAGLMVFAKVLQLVSRLLGGVVKLLSPILNVLDSFMSWLDSFLDIEVDMTNALADAQESELEQLQRLKDEYSALYDAMKEQEEYYLNKKNEINAEQYKINATPVNDMILTDKGVFSTDPKDTIMAMKRPGDLLGGGSSHVYVTVNNYAGVDVTTEERTTDGGDTELIVNISRAVASDFASGANGWDSAYESQQSRISGRMVSI